MMTLCTLLVSIGAPAVPPPAVAAAPSPARREAKPPLLSGPDVPAQDGSLVRRDFQGRFVPVEGHPAETALRLVLDPTRAEAARELARDRELELATLLVDRIDLVREITDAITSGEAATAQRLQRRLYDLFDPAHVRDPLAERADALVTDDERRALAELLDEYWSAWIDWELRDEDDRTDAARSRVREELSYGLFRRDLQIAYAMSLRPYRTLLERIYEIAEASAAQRSEIREAVLDLIKTGGATPTPAQRRVAAQRIWQTLDEAQRLRVFERALGW